ENWGFIVSAQPAIHLAPTFDHASSLGWNETDETRLQRLTTKDARRSIDRYVEKALSAFFSSPTSSTPLTTLEVFWKRQGRGPWQRERGLTGSPKFQTMPSARYLTRFQKVEFRTSVGGLPQKCLN